MEGVFQGTMIGRSDCCPRRNFEQLCAFGKDSIVKGARHPTLMGIFESSKLGTTTLVVSTTQDCWSGVEVNLHSVWSCCKTFGTGHPTWNVITLAKLRFKSISILKVINQFWWDWHARGMWWLGEQAERNSWPGYHLSPGQHRKERVLMVVNCCSVVGVWLCAFFLSVWLFDYTYHLHTFADHGAQGGTLVIAIAVISFKTD